MTDPTPVVRSSKATFATNPHGHVVQMLPVAFGRSEEYEVTQNGTPAILVHDNPNFQFIRIWSIGCALDYVFGGPEVEPPTYRDGYLGAGMSDQFPLLPTQTHIRAKARDGEGSFRIELLGY